MENKYHIHLVSDATGETINSVLRACLVQFPDVTVEEHFWNLIRNKRQLDMVAEGLRQWPGLVFYTFVDKDLEQSLTDYCRRQNMLCVSILDPVIRVLTDIFGVSSSHQPGKQHSLTEEYFARIHAIDFALALDDGNKVEKVSDADVLILGVSRTSKTPTCLYLANRGIKAANIPIVPEVPISEEIFSLTIPLIVGLVEDPDVLVEVRRNRMKSLRLDDSTDYIDPEKVRSEMSMARRLFARLECPVINITSRSVEETAAEIMMLMSKRKLEVEIARKLEMNID